MRSAMPEWANLPVGTLIEWTYKGTLRRARTILPMWRSGRNSFTYTLLAADGHYVNAKKVRPVLPVAD